MKKYILSLCVGLVIILPTISLAQGWVARYNGPGDSLDRAYAIALDDSGNIYVTGTSWGSGTSLDYATVKYDSSGVEQWVARYNGPGDSLDRAYAIALDNSGNIYVTGESEGSGTWYDYATVKYDSSGVEQWVARYNGPLNSGDYAYAIALDNSDNVYVTGASWGLGTYCDYATVKYDSSGVEQWVARYNGPGNDGDGAYAIALDNSDNIYVTGLSYDFGTSLDYATVKYDSSGVEQWVARYNGPGNDYDCAYAITLDNSGNIYVTGGSWGSGTDVDFATVKYDSSGVEQWVGRYNGPGNDWDRANAIALDNSGNVYVTGPSWGIGTFEDYATVKYDSSGVEQWVARYNGPGNDWDWALAIALDNSDNIYVTGTSVGLGTFYDYATMKYDSSGVEQWVKRYNNSPANSSDWAYAIALDNSGNIYITGQSVGSGTDYDYATIKYLQVGVEEEVGSKKQETRLEIYQNPSRYKVDIRWQITENIDRNLIIYNATGRLIKEFHITDHSFNRVTWDGRDNSGKKVPSGIYFLKFQAGSYIETKKIILFR